MTARPCLRVGVAARWVRARPPSSAISACCMRKDYNMAVVTNDIYTREDAEFLLRHNALEADRILGVETAAARTRPYGKTPPEHPGLEALQRRHPGLELVLVESGRGQLSATFSPELAD